MKRHSNKQLLVELVPNGELAQFSRFRHRQNPFCSLMSQFTSSCAACQQVHAELQQRITVSLAPQTICCFAGLTEFAVPVMVGGKLVAILLGGQVFRRKPSQAQFTRLTKQLRVWGIDRQLRRIKRAYFATHIILGKQFQASTRLLAIFTSFLAEDINRDLLAANVHDYLYVARAALESGVVLGSLGIAVI